MGAQNTSTYQRNNSKGDLELYAAVYIIAAKYYIIPCCSDTTEED